MDKINSLTHCENKSNPQGPNWKINTNQVRKIATQKKGRWNLSKIYMSHKYEFESNGVYTLIPSLNGN